MTVRQLWVQSTAYNAQDDRLLLAAMLPPGPAAPLGSRTGVRGPADLALTLTDARNGRVGRGAAYIPFGASIYLATNDEDAPVTFEAADVTNARIDRVGVRVFDAEAGGGDAAPAVVVLTGAPSQTPVPPTAPDGFLPLYELRFNAGSTAPIITDQRKVIVADEPHLPYAEATPVSSSTAQGWTGWGITTVVADPTGTIVATGAGYRVTRTGLYLATFYMVSNNSGVITVSIRADDVIPLGSQPASPGDGQASVTVVRSLTAGQVIAPFIFFPTGGGTAGGGGSRFTTTYLGARRLT